MVVKKSELLGPFRTALAGIVYTFKTQRHMRFHLYVVVAVLTLAQIMNFRLRETLILLFVISLVLIAEMFNSAIEATIDLVQPTYHPQAKYAKDIAAGAVLITTTIALLVGGLMLLGENRWEEIRISLTSNIPSVPAAQRIAIGLVLVFVIVIIGKGLGKRGRVFKGGIVSGHAAFGFFIAGSIMFLTDKILIAALAIILAAIIAQSRWEAKIHTIFELSLGAAVGVIMALIFFGIAPK